MTNLDSILKRHRHYLANKGTDTDKNMLQRTHTQRPPHFTLLGVPGEQVLGGHGAAPQDRGWKSGLSQEAWGQGVKENQVTSRQMRRPSGHRVHTEVRREEVEGILCSPLKPLHFCKGPRGH